MKPPLSSYSEEPSNGSQDVILRKLSRGDRHDDEEEVFSMNEIPFSKVEKVRRHSTIHRTKSQWENFVESVDVSKSIHSGVFKLTLHQLARDGETSALVDLLKNVPVAQRMRMLNTASEDDGGTPLHLAARHNHYQVCQLLIKNGASVNARGDGLATPLHFAAKYKPKKRLGQDNPKKAETPNVISLLASSGADANLRDAEGQTPLHAASIKGNSKAIHELLQCPSIDIQAFDNLGMTALHMAATHGYVEIVEMLIEKGSDLHSYDDDCMTPLHFACSEGSTKIVQLLLEKGFANGQMTTVSSMLKWQDAGGSTCLHMSIEKGHKEMVLQLLEWMKKAGDVKHFVNKTRAHNNTALHIAASQGHCEIAEILIDHGAKIDARNDTLATPLLLAAQYNYFKIVQLFRKHKAEMEVRDKDGMTPLLIASKNGNLETVSWLIENGADVTASDKDDKRCLMLAVEVKRIRTVQRLLNYPAVKDLLFETDKNANSVLHIAAKKGHVPLIKILAANNARINFKNEDEATPVHIAAMYGQHAALWQLLQSDEAMINSLDENANTALHMAANQGHTKCVQILLDYGANVEFRNTRQWSALDCACAKGRDSTVLELLQAQSPVNPPKLSKTTPLHQACLNGHVQIVNLLLEWKADVSARILDGRNPLDCAIDKGHRSCVRAILLHDSWKNAMRNAYFDLFSGHLTTPGRKLIVKMPDMAELAFSRCITNNGKPLDDKNLEVTLDYEFLDDMYSVTEWNQSDPGEKIIDQKKMDGGIFNPNSLFWKAFNVRDALLPVLPHSEIFDFNDFGRPYEMDESYSLDSSILRYNHPLHIMANRKRETLLRHPVVTGLLLYKWKKYGGLVYYSSLSFLLLFVTLLNIYLLVIPPPYSIDFQKSLANQRFYINFKKSDLFIYTRPKPCYSSLQSGTEYRGFANTSESGNSCLSWKDTPMTSQLFPEAGLDNNYCRNPETQFKKPWCYTKINSTDPTKTKRETCNVDPCPVYVKGPHIPLGQTCHFPFLYGGKNVSECIRHDGELKWCAYTYDSENGKKGGKCSKENTLCDVNPEYRELCGTIGIDRFNCEARGCCFEPRKNDESSDSGSCYKMLDHCNDKVDDCLISKNLGYCVKKSKEMKINCSKTCGFCNVTEHHDDEHVEGDERHDFLHLVSNFPIQTFDPDWSDGCYYVVKEAEKKWGSGCHYRKFWEEPIRIFLCILSSANLVLLFIQIWNYKWDAFQPIIFLKAILFISSLLLSLNFGWFDIEISRQMNLEKKLFLPLINQFQYVTGIRQHWQWQCGAIALFLSWMDLLLYIRKIPYLGIYVVMFNDVFRTFVKFSAVFLLFILSFALTFHALLQNGIQFEDPFKSIVKTTVMIIGEIDFREIFYSKFTTYPHLVHYQFVTFIIFFLFIIVMMIIIMNLLIGLAVGDIMEVKQNATLERLKMQVDLALEVEFSVPNFLRKRFVRKNETIRPNRYRQSNALIKALFQNHSLTSKNIVHAMTRNKSENEEIRENVSVLNHVMVKLCNKTNDVDAMMREMVQEIREFKQKMEISVFSPSPQSGTSRVSNFLSIRSMSSIDEQLNTTGNFATCEEVKSAGRYVF